MCKRNIKKTLSIFVCCSDCNYTYFALNRKCPCCGSKYWWIPR